MSESDAARPVLAKYCVGVGVDCGFGGSAMVPHAITMDMETPYTNTGGDTQIIKGSVRDLSMFCDNSLDFFVQSHLLEDFSYKSLVRIVSGIRRILKPGGLFINNCPDQPTYVRYCRENNHPYNEAHLESDFSLETFKEKVLKPTGPWEIEFEQPVALPYSWYLVVKKLA